MKRSVYTRPDKPLRIAVKARSDFAKVEIASTPEIIAAIRARCGSGTGAPDTMMLFAAGKGTRMAPLTDVTPKPLIPVAGRPLLDHALDLAREGGARRIVVNTHHLGDQIVRHLAGSGVAISDEADALLETGGGLKKALPLLGDGPVLTMNPDVVWTGPNPVAALRAALREPEEGIEVIEVRGSRADLRPFHDALAHPA